MSMINAFTVASGNVDGASAGRVDINVGDLLIDGRFTDESEFFPCMAAAEFYLTLARSKGAIGNGTEITTQNNGGGALGPVAGPVEIAATTYLMLDGGAVTSTTVSGGNAGAITIDTPDLDLLNGAVILTDASVDEFYGLVAGNAGPITINAADITISGATSGLLCAPTCTSAREHSNIGAFAMPGAGHAGDVTITTGAGGIVRLIDGGQITAFSNNQNAGGTVTINAGTVEISGAVSAALAALPVNYGNSDVILPGIGPNSALIADTFSSGAGGHDHRAGAEHHLHGRRRGALEHFVHRARRHYRHMPRWHAVGFGRRLGADREFERRARAGDAGVIGVQAAAVTLERGGRSPWRARARAKAAKSWCRRTRST